MTLKHSNGGGANPFILTGGFPCQPYSCAGKRRGKEDDRFLWPQVKRVIKEVQSKYIILENVTGLFSILEPDSLSEVEISEIELFQQDEYYPITRVIERIHKRIIARIITDIQEVGYVLPELSDGTPIVLCIPACAVNAPHRRDRVWIIASKADCHVADTEGRETHPAEPRGLHSEPCGKDSVTSNNDSKCGEEQFGGDKLGKAIREKTSGRSFQRTSWETNWLEVATRLCRVDDGVPQRMDRVNRLRALGNAIVPQVAYQIMKAIIEVDQ